MKKVKSMIITALLTLMLILPSANASVISQLVEEPIPAPFLVISSTYEPFSNQIIFDLKILNIPDEFPIVDIYIFLKGLEATNENELAAVKNPLTDLIPTGDETELPESSVYFISFGLLGLTASTTEAAFVPNINLAELAAQMGTKDVVVPGFPVDASIIPNIKNGRYVVYLALIEKAEEEQLIASTIDLLEVIRDLDIMPEIEKEPCDFDKNGVVDEWEAKYCGCDFNGDGNIDEQEQVECDQMSIDKCDFNGDGFVDETEAAQCAEMQKDPCDFNGDGIVDEEEAAQCEQMQKDPCDFNGDGIVDEEEAAQCEQMQKDPCDFNGDGFVDETEAAQCAEMQKDPCDFNGDGIVDEEEAAQCEQMYIDKCDTNGDGVVDEIEAEQCIKVDTAIACDFDKNGEVDEWEAQYCGCDFDGDGIINEEEQKKCDEEKADANGNITDIIGDII